MAVAVATAGVALPTCTYLSPRTTSTLSTSATTANWTIPFDLSPT
jgi:hypothetical protein